MSCIQKRWLLIFGNNKIPILQNQNLNQDIQLFCQYLMNTYYNRASHKQGPVQQICKDQWVEMVQLKCIDTLKQHLMNILQTAQLQESTLIHNHQQIVSNLQQQNDQLQQKYQEMLFKYQSLISQNSRIKLNFNRCTTTIKQLEKKDKLLNNQIIQLNKIVTQKEAIIKYLEQKQQQSKTRKSVNQSSKDSQSCLSNSRSKGFIPSLPLQRLSLPQALKQAKFQDFMPQTTRSIETQNFTRQNYIVSQQLKRQHYSKEPSLENTHNLAKYSDLYTQRSFESSKNLYRNESSFLLKHYSKAYDYSLWKHVNQNNYKQYQSNDSNTFNYYNRSSLTTNRFRLGK